MSTQMQNVPIVRKPAPRQAIKTATNNNTTTPILRKPNSPVRSPNRVGFSNTKVYPIPHRKQVNKIPIQIRDELKNNNHPEYGEEVGKINITSGYTILGDPEDLFVFFQQFKNINDCLQSINKHQQKHEWTGEPNKSGLIIKVSSNKNLRMPVYHDNDKITIERSN